MSDSDSDSDSETPRRASTEVRSEVVSGVREGVAEVLEPVKRFVELVGDHMLMLFRAITWLPRRPFRAGNYFDAGEYIGFGSLPIILLVGTFTGAVTSLQMVKAFELFGLQSIAGGITGKSLSLELAPVLTCLMLTGRAGAGIATELGTMRITEQIDALETMAINPIQFLVLPRLVMGLIMAPILTLLFFIVGMVGAWLVAVGTLNVDHGQFVDNFEQYVQMSDIAQGLIKSALFGVTVILIACYQGFHATGGGRGVGLGTTRAVVAGSVAVLVLDYFATDILLQVLPQQK